MENNDFDLLEEFFIHHVHNFKIDKIDRFNHQKNNLRGLPRTPSTFCPFQSVNL